MRISSLTLSNFRCFGVEPTVIKLDDITTFVGSNACGKTAVLSALARLFGVSSGDRGIRKSDFHLPTDTDLAKISELSLFIEVCIAFPELEEEDTPSEAVPECFRQMSVDAPQGSPYCRVRLDAKWTKTTLPEGEVEESLVWVNTSGHVVEDEHKSRMTGDQRSRIHVLYVPASRDPQKQLRQAAGTLLHRLLGAIRWSDSIREKVENASNESNQAFRAEPGVAVIEEMINDSWSDLHDFRVLKNVHLRPLNPQFEDLLQQVEMVFSPGEGATEQPAERLSDGLRSLFYLTLIASVFHAEDHAIQDAEKNGDKSPLRGKELEAPSLTVLAIEEPENHLAPHYLGRILKLISEIASSHRAQALLTSHSPAILRRIDPASVRHLRLDPKAHRTIVSRITLPNEADEAYKYVRQAVKAYPELYFARLVVLCEGDSEELILPKLCELAKVPVDPSFISIVPLGGRHVNHFWRLLHELAIPYITLLDLDRERETGGWARVKYIIDHLLLVGTSKDKLLEVTDKNGRKSVLSDDEFARMPEWDQSNCDDLCRWLHLLEMYNVFFSYPLDIDFAMLQRFPNAYHLAKSDRGPRIPDRKMDAEGFKKRLRSACRAVLKSDQSKGITYSSDQKEAFIWYQHLFLGRGKPSTHILALNEIKPTILWKKAPVRLKRLIGRVQEMLK
jgi:putative ATP-dependent endonuclease of the OLD family